MRALLTAVLICVGALYLLAGLVALVWTYMIVFQDFGILGFIVGIVMWPITLFGIPILEAIRGNYWLIAINYGWVAAYYLFIIVFSAGDAVQRAFKRA